MVPVYRNSKRTALACDKMGKDEKTVVIFILHPDNTQVLFAVQQRRGVFDSLAELFVDSHRHCSEKLCTWIRFQPHKLETIGVAGFFSSRVPSAAGEVPACHPAGFPPAEGQSCRMVRAESYCRRASLQPAGPSPAGPSCRSLSAGGVREGGVAAAAAAAGEGAGGGCYTTMDRVSPNTASIRTLK